MAMKKIEPEALHDLARAFMSALQPDNTYSLEEFMAEWHESMTKNERTIGYSILDLCQFHDVW